MMPYCNMRLAKSQYPIKQKIKIFDIFINLNYPALAKFLMLCYNIHVYSDTINKGKTMTIFLNILFLVVGMVLLIKGADFFVSGASAVAKRFKIPAMFIGLTVVALGTSLPELSVSIASAIKGSTDMSVGNIVGSNMMNMLLILGIVTLIKPVPINKSSKKIDFPFLIGITVLLLLFCADTILNGATANVVSRTESIVLLVMLIIYITILIFNTKKEHKLLYDRPESIEPTKEEVKVEETTENNDNKKSKKRNKEKKDLKIWQIVIYIIFGLGAVVFGAECVSTTAQYLAIKMGMSEALVGLTIVAIGTSLPELATSIAASIKGENSMALGNIIGSSVINIALILGVVGVISPVVVSSTILVDMLILTVCTIIFAVLCMTRKQNINRWIGGILVSMNLAYIAFAIVRNYCFPTWLA